MHVMLAGKKARQAGVLRDCKFGLNVVESEFQLEQNVAPEL